MKAEDCTADRKVSVWSLGQAQASSESEEVGIMGLLREVREPLKTQLRNQTNPLAAVRLTLQLLYQTCGDLDGNFIFWVITGTSMEPKPSG